MSAVLEENLEEKYAPAIAVARQAGIEWQEIRVDSGKLYLKGKAPGVHAREKVLHLVKDIDPEANDINLEISVPRGRGDSTGLRYYTVRAGDTLEKISRQFYGTAREYKRIFEANSEKVSNPYKIQAGEVLIIPED